MYEYGIAVAPLIGKRSALDTQNACAGVSVFSGRTLTRLQTWFEEDSRDICNVAFPKSPQCSNSCPQAACSGSDDPEGALQQGNRPFSLSFSTSAGNVTERLVSPGLFEPRPVRTFTLIAAGVTVRWSDPAETRHSSAISLPAQYLPGIPVYPKNPLARTWSIAETNQAIAAGDKACALSHESTRSTNEYIQYCSRGPAGSRPPP